PVSPRLPRKDDPRRVQWLENSRRRDPSGEGRWDPTSKYIYFCSQHFESSCFEVVGYSGVHISWGGAAAEGLGEDLKVPLQKVLGVTPPPGTQTSPGVCTAGTPCEVLGTPQGPSLTSGFPLRSPLPGGVPALPGPSGAIPETLLVATGDEEATTTPALPEGAPPAPAAPAGPPGPPSPSLFMLRLPPRAGSYIQSEHSYQVGSALLWKR
ncbi:THAP7 protein, partial [Grantiella picta]|nr:THAP7 protein [Grantiella picta]